MRVVVAKHMDAGSDDIYGVFRNVQGVMLQVLKDMPSFEYEDDLHWRTVRDAFAEHLGMDEQAQEQVDWNDYEEVLVDLAEITYTWETLYEEK